MKEQGLRHELVANDSQLQQHRIAYCGPIKWCSGLAPAPQFSQSIWIPPNPALRQHIQSQLTKCRTKLNISMWKILAQTMLPFFIVAIVVAVAIVKLGEKRREEGGEGGGGKGLGIWEWVCVGMLLGCEVVAILCTFRKEQKAAVMIQNALQQINRSLEQTHPNISARIKSSKIRPPRTITDCCHIQILQNISTIQLTTIQNQYLYSNHTHTHTHNHNHNQNQN